MPYYTDLAVSVVWITGMINASVELHYWAADVTPQTATGLYVRPFFEGLFSPPVRAD